MAILDMFRVGKIKAELEEVKADRDTLKATLADTEHLEHYELQRAIAELARIKTEKEKEIQDLDMLLAQRRKGLDQQIADLNQEIVSKRNELIVLDDEILLQSFGFYTPKYDLVNSEAYKMKLDQIRNAQEEMVKSGQAALYPTNWTVNNNLKEGERMIKDYVKLILRSFNNECDASIISVKFNNIQSIEKRIMKAFETLNKLGKRLNIAIVPQYLNLKLQELYLCHEYQIKKQEEKEEQKRMREQLREEARVQKEIEDMKLKLAKEETHFINALTAITTRLMMNQSEAERALLEKEKAMIEQRMAQLEEQKLDVLNRERNTRAGHVYVISNIGAFGEHVYKIGLTRRLEPQERIDELGDASVPFDFDIHAVIFSDDAPALENALHKAFEDRRLNLINRRREFFKVTLEEIEQVVKQNFEKPVELIIAPEASEYRQSLMLRNGS